MSAQRASAETTEWSSFVSDESPTATRRDVTEASRFGRIEGAVAGVFNNPPHPAIDPAAVFLTANTVSVPYETASYALVSLMAPGTVLFGKGYGSTRAFVPHEDELLTAIIHASEDVRTQCLRLLKAMNSGSARDVESDGLMSTETLLTRDAEDHVTPVLGESVTSADHALAAVATSYGREEVALRVPFGDEE